MTGSIIRKNANLVTGRQWFRQSIANETVLSTVRDKAKLIRAPVTDIEDEVRVRRPSSFERRGLQWSAALNVRQIHAL